MSGDLEGRDPGFGEEFRRGALVGIGVVALATAAITAVCLVIAALVLVLL